MASYTKHLKLLLGALSPFYTLVALAQLSLGGSVRDEASQPLPGVSIRVLQGASTLSDANGNFRISVDKPGTYDVILSYVGFETQTRKADPAKDSNVVFILKASSSQLDQVVVSAGRYEQEVKRLTVSTDIIRPYLVSNKVTVNMEQIMNQLPSVNVIDGQANIRGGSGWTYGAGSRVLVMLNDMPYQTGDAGQVQWKFLPVENLEQIEVIKGASSVLYGSSALNGVINIRTATPKAKPETSVSTFAGFYDKLPRDSSRWNKGTQWQYGMNAWHSQKIKRLDLNISMNYLKDEGYRLGESDERVRISVATNYHHRKIPGLQYGINASGMIQNSASFLLWESYQLSYTALDSSQTRTTAYSMSVDPHLDFYAWGLKHRIRTRIMRTVNNVSAADTGTNQDNSYLLFYGEYQLQKYLPRNLGVITGGVAGSQTVSKSPLYQGDHQVGNLAPFAQLDLRLGRFSYTLGLRHEYFKMDEETQQRTIFRTGLNTELTKSTFLRLSYGQGYRFPTIAERYISTTVGALHVFPNPNLRAESGWTAESGIKQGFRIANWQGYADLAYFWTEYDNMVEFNFGVWKALDLSDITKSLGFKSFNVGRTRITGLDLTLAGQGKIGKVNVNVLAGYTFTRPVSLEPDKVFAEDSVGNRYSYRSTSIDSGTTVLKYRYAHLAKADLELSYSIYTAGFSMRYNSFMQNIDNTFINIPFSVLVPGVEQARTYNTSGDWLFDVRVGFRPVKRAFVNFVINNITGHEQMTRPADMRPPRMYLLQLTYKI